MTTIVNLSNGNRLKFDRSETEIFEFISNISLEDKMDLFQISAKDLREYLKLQDEQKRVELGTLLERRWFYPETGELIKQHSTVAIFNNKEYTMKQIKRAYSAGCLDIDLVYVLHNIFTNEFTN